MSSLALASKLKLAALKIIFLDELQQKRVMEEVLEYKEQLNNHIYELEKKFPQLSQLTKKQYDLLFHQMNNQDKDGWDPILKKVESLKQQNQSHPYKLYELIRNSRGL